MKYVPYITTRIDDEFGVQTLEEYDDTNLFDTYEEAEAELDKIMSESDGPFGIFAIENGEIAHRYNCGPDDDDDCFDFDSDDLEMGFNPYMGCYDYDC